MGVSRGGGGPGGLSLFSGAFAYAGLYVPFQKCLCRDEA